MSLQVITRFKIVILVLGFAIVTVTVIRWHAILEGREITYFDLAGGLALTSFFTLAVYFGQMARSQQKELEAANLELNEKVSAHKWAETQLKSSEAAYRSLVEHLPSTTWVYVARLDDVASAVYISPQIKTLGFSQEEWVNNRDYWYRQLHPDDRGRVLAEFRRHYASDEPFSCEYRLLTRNNEVRWFRDEAAVLKDEAGNHICVQGILTDISERSRLESQLHQAQKMEAVGQLAAGIAHDFNNILTTISGCAEFLLMKMKEEDPLCNFVKEISTAGEKGVSLVKNILTFSRKDEFDPIPRDINEIIREVKDTLMRLIGEDIELRTELAEESLMILVDAVQIEQALINLATNARDAMPDVGTLSITTRAMELDESFLAANKHCMAGMYVMISVADTGVGIDEESRKRIFEPFYTTKEVEKGTGLGLPMTYGIVRRHKGFIDVVSEPGTGTTFNIYLPLTGQTRKIEEAGLAYMAATHADCAGTVLIAEDEPSLREVTSSHLSEFGYGCIEAVDGEDAVTMFMEKRDSIDLVILDVVMPKKNGRDVYEELIRLKPGIKVIFISGYNSEVLARKGIDEKEFNVIRKPFSPETLLSKVTEILHKEAE